MDTNKMKRVVKSFLDEVSSPEEMIFCLDMIGQRLMDDSIELQSAHQDPNAGYIWIKIGRRLQSTADDAQDQLTKYY